MLKRINHIGLAVKDMDAAIRLFESAFQVKLDSRETVEDGGFEVAAFVIGEGKVELLAPLRPDSVIGKFIEKRGEGIHHVALEVDDLEGKLAHLDAVGLVRVDNEPRRGLGGSKTLFLHPKSLLGTLVELVELPPPTSET